MSGPQPKKSLGQHFLVDDNILGVIARLAELDAADVVLEIGPGLGALTRVLADQCAHVHAVELDHRLESHLRGIAAAPNVTLHWGDALRLDLGSFEPAPTKLVANLPYNVATPIVAESLDGLPGIEQWCVMVQREVADRFFAVPSTKAYGAVSVLIQLATTRTAFHPGVTPSLAKRSCRSCASTAEAGRGAHSLRNGSPTGSAGVRGQSSSGRRARGARASAAGRGGRGFASRAQSGHHADRRRSRPGRERCSPGVAANVWPNSHCQTR